MNAETQSAAEYAEIRGNVLRQLQVGCRAKGLGRSRVIIRAFYQEKSPR